MIKTVQCLFILLIFGSGFLTDVIGEALGTLAGPALPWVLGDPAGPLAGDSLKKVQITQIREELKWISYIKQI